MKALHELDKDEYIKHLEYLILDGGINCDRCEHCKRVQCREEMTAVIAGPDLFYVCDTCLRAYDRAEKEAQEIAESDERDYRDAKGRV